MVLVVSREAVLECCSSAAFADKLAARETYADLEEIIGAARDIWWNEVPVLTDMRRMPDGSRRADGPIFCAADPSCWLAGGLCCAPLDWGRGDAEEEIWGLCRDEQGRAGCCCNC
jgi:hypothetical protein